MNSIANKSYYIACKIHDAVGRRKTQKSDLSDKSEKLYF